MKYCPDCGALLRAHALPGAENCRRWQCEPCGRVHHDHPSIMLTCFISCGRKLLWMQRKLEPKRGYWAIPGGFMERGESLAEGAARELWEETGIRMPADSLQLYMTGTITFINQVYVAFRASVSSESCVAGAEAQAVAFYARDECPWDLLAYPEVNDCIQQAYDDLEQSRFGLYHAQMTTAVYELVPVRQSMRR